MMSLDPREDTVIGYLSALDELLGLTEAEFDALPFKLGVPPKFEVIWKAGASSPWPREPEPVSRRTRYEDDHGTEDIDF
jgi:hypothetical protein